MKFEELCAHIKAKKQVRVACFNISRHTRSSIGIPVRVFRRLKSGRVRRYVTIEMSSGDIKERCVDMCHVRSMSELPGSL